ncbi:mediator of RNA polymerase II transcription subunit 28-like [Liolophura sinensis]|uniref:mediator of RNA polymerase II transcription subunit 28-like n=1 Tax=Liolophura sinensis TaxID=3198878 RepID=UPI00315850F0
MAGPPTTSFPSTNASGGHLVEDLESAFQDCIKTLTAQEYFNASDSDEVKSSVEQNLQKFLDLARQTEAVFLQKRLLVSVKKPEQVVKEDIQELRQELMRKEAMLVKHQEKLQQWQNLMRSIQSGQPVPNQAATGLSHPNQPSQQGMPTNLPHPGQHSQQGQQPASQSMMIGGQGHPYSGGPGPLAYLEQTMSNIGMPERR